MREDMGLYRGKTTPKPTGHEFNEIWVYGDLLWSREKCYIHPRVDAFGTPPLRQFFLKPILFNTEMVRAILEGRKTVTRRVVRGKTWFKVDPQGHNKPALEYAPYRPGDILYVRETWNFGYIETPDVEGSYDAWFEEWDWRTREQHRYLNTFSRFWYKADEDDVGDVRIPWRPSIHMPKEAARIFLRVTDVRVERLQEITVDGCKTEGIEPLEIGTEAQGFREPQAYLEAFEAVWDNTIKYPYHPRYGWAANPWVWVIGFERCEKPERGRE